MILRKFFALPGLLPYIPRTPRLKSCKRKKSEGEEEKDVVKGTARRVIVVDSPDPGVFEQAIFVVREDYLKKPGVSQRELMRQAKAAAGKYLGTVTKTRRFGFLYRFPAAWLAAAGAAVTGLAYVVLRMAGIY
jgi:hypothetical protein